MTDEQNHDNAAEEPVSEATPQEQTRFPELAELQEKIDRRLRSNQRFLERFLDEDFDDLVDDDEDIVIDDDDDPGLNEEL